MEVYPCQDSKRKYFEIDGQMLNSSDDYIKWDKIKNNNLFDYTRR